MKYVQTVHKIITTRLEKKIDENHTGYAYNGEVNQRGDDNGAMTRLGRASARSIRSNSRASLGFVR